LEYNHQHIDNEYLGNAFKIGITINVIFIVLEVIFGLLSNSMALVSDAGHNFSDVIALIFSWLAIMLSQRKPTSKFTYGFRRSTILAAILNTVLLLVAVGFLLWETIQRIGKPVIINSKNIIIIAIIAIFVNGFTAWLFHKNKKHDLNIRSAFVHFIADTLVSLGVVISGVIMYFTGFTWLDTAVSFIIIAVILISLYKLLVDSVSLALDAVPENIDIEAVRQYLNNISEVNSIHDLHIWALSTSAAALTVHLETNTQTDVDFLSKIQHELDSRFKIEHSTIQVEYGKAKGECNDCN